MYFYGKAISIGLSPKVELPKLPAPKLELPPSPKKLLLEKVLPTGIKTILPQKKIPYVIPRPIAQTIRTTMAVGQKMMKKYPPGILPKTLEKVSDTLKYGGQMSIAPSLRRSSLLSGFELPSKRIQQKKKPIAHIMKPKKKHIVPSCAALAQETPIPPGMKLPTVAPGGTKLISIAVPKGHKPVIVRRSRLPKRPVIRKSIAQQITRRKPGHRRVGAKYYYS